jgi:hypothetical protein
MYIKNRVDLEFAPDLPYFGGRRYWIGIAPEALTGIESAF